MSCFFSLSCEAASENKKNICTVSCHTPEKISQTTKKRKQGNIHRFTDGVSCWVDLEVSCFEKRKVSDEHPVRRGSLSESLWKLRLIRKCLTSFLSPANDVDLISRFKNKQVSLEFLFFGWHLLSDRFQGSKR